MTGQPERLYTNDHEFLRDELRLLDLRIGLRAKTLPLLNEIAPGSQVDRTTYITPDEVTWLLEQSDGHPDDHNFAPTRGPLATLSAAIRERVAASRAAGTILALPRAAELFGLSEFETQALVICLAPELRAKYDRLYAYLQDDITRKRPSVDLIFSLLCESEHERWQSQPMLSGTGALFRWRLVQIVPDPHSPSGSSGLAQFLRLDPRICRFLLGDNHMDAHLAAVARLHHPGGNTSSVVDQAVAAIVRQLLSSPRDPSRRLVVYLHGPREAGKWAVALQVCHEQELGVIAADMEELLACGGDEAAALLREACREAALQDGVLYIERADALLRAPFGEVGRSLRHIGTEPGCPVLLGGEQPWTAGHLFADTHFETVLVPNPDIAQRARMWRRHLNGRAPDVSDWAEDLAARFTAGQDRIGEAISRAEQHRVRRSPAAPLTVEDLAAACREQSRENLGGLAGKVEPRYSWLDLVLSEPKIQQLKEICGQVRHHRLVYETWGFGQKLRHGTGLSVLFAGPPGTGKTMAAEVVARAVGLSLFKIDLSGVVSKYIGETEKNLARIFQEAQSCNAILFFDEADALFGKRTEVSDAHDRYANIETSYLLQKLDEHEGLVLLASNLRANLDEAFTRRMRYVVEFPFPDAVHRQRIWESHFPAETPLADDIDFAALAAEFEIAGGNIKNIVINAAFLAAADGQCVGARHIMTGTRREFEKLGKLWCEPSIQREATS